MADRDRKRALAAQRVADGSLDPMGRTQRFAPAECAQRRYGWEVCQYRECLNASADIYVVVPLTKRNTLARRCPSAKFVVRVEGTMSYCPREEWPNRWRALIVPSSDGEPCHATVQWRRTSSTNGNVASNRPSSREPGSVRSGSKDQNVGEPEYNLAFDSSGGPQHRPDRIGLAGLVWSWFVGRGCSP